MTEQQPFIHQQFNWPIWRTEIDDTSGNLLVELRNTQEKQTAFGSVNLLTGKVNFTDVNPPERWLTGMEAAYDGVLLIHHYESATGPVHKGLIAIDAVTGNTLWSNYTLAFDHLSINGPIVYNAQLLPHKLFLADMKTGANLRAYEPVIDLPPTNYIIGAQLMPASLLPGLTLPHEPYTNTVHYIEHNTYRIVSLHTFFQEKLKQHLYIINNEGAVVYQDLLNSDIQKLQPEAFVVHKNNLIYLKERSVLVVLNL
jgi:outer membrane protein assembly factor BamB